MKSIFKKIKDEMNITPTPYYKRLSWKIIVPRLLSQMTIAITTLFLQCIKIFVATMLILLVIDRLIQDKMSSENILSLYFFISFIDLFLLPFLRRIKEEGKEKYYIQMCGVGKVITYHSVDMPDFDTSLDVEKPYEKVVYKLVPRHNYGYVWNKFAEIADIFDPITYHLYDNNGNRVSNAVLDRLSWDRPSLLKDVEGE